MPKWETTKFLKNLGGEESTSFSKTSELSNGNQLYSVPLVDQEGITSILYSEVNGEEVIHVREIANIDLWDIIHHEELDKSYREFLLLNCLYYDKEIFKDYVFINIPTGLLGIEEGMPNKIRLPHNTEYENQLMSVTQTCIFWISNCTCPNSWDECDHCNNGDQCNTNYICTSAWEDDGNDPNSGGNGGGNSGGGGSGGHGHPTGTPNLPPYWRINFLILTARHFHFVCHQIGYITCFRFRRFCNFAREIFL